MRVGWGLVITTMLCCCCGELLLLSAKIKCKIIQQQLDDGFFTKKTAGSKNGRCSMNGALLFVVF
jgi:hypothetical protein